MSHFKSFNPDLVVEVTNVCNKSCPGCYAPNIITTKSNTKTNKNGKFLRASDLENTWLNIPDVDTVAIRGGEPTLNPEILNIISYISTRAKHVYLETNGDWIKDGDDLINSVKNSNLIVKLSVDSMHGSSIEETRKRIEKLKRHSIKSMIAVTEEDLTTFELFIEMHLSDFEGPILFQRKAKKIQDILKPRIGVLNTQGQLVNTVSVKSSFLSNLEDEVTA